MDQKNHHHPPLPLPPLPPFTSERRKYQRVALKTPKSNEEKRVKARQYQATWRAKNLDRVAEYKKRLRARQKQARLLWLEITEGGSNIKPLQRLDQPSDPPSQPLPPIEDKKETKEKNKG